MNKIKKPLRIFVYADMAFKITRCLEKGEVPADLTDDELKQKIKSVDKHRAKYYQFHTGQAWGCLLYTSRCV